NFNVLFSHQLHISLSVLLFFLMLPPPPRSTLFPYTTLFRSQHHRGDRSHSPGGRRGSARTRGATRDHGLGREVRKDGGGRDLPRSEEHTSELQSRFDLVCRLLLEKKKKKQMYE